MAFEFTNQGFRGVLREIFEQDIALSGEDFLKISAFFGAAEQLAGHGIFVAQLVFDFANEAKVGGGGGKGQQIVIVV